LKTLKLKIINKSEEYDDYIYQSTGLFYMIYNNYNLINDLVFKSKCLDKFPLIDDVCVFRSFVSDVETKIKQNNTIKKNKDTELKELYKSLNKCFSYEKPKIQKKISKNRK